MPENKTDNSSEKLSALRKAIKREKLDGYIVPRADEWQGEYVPDCAARLEWLTGFTGSAGVAAVLNGKAAICTDSRYTEQIEKQVDDTLYEADSSSTPVSEWIAAQAKENAVIGYDPKLLTVSQVKDFTQTLAKKHIKLRAVEDNLVNRIWRDRPAHPSAPVFLFPEKIAGKSAADKCADISGQVSDAGGASVFLAAPDSVNWLLNVRGGDVPHVPQVLSYALVHSDASVDWFVPPGKVPADVRQALGGAVRIHGFEDMPAVLEQAGRAAAGKQQTILLDEARTPVWFQLLLAQGGAETAHFPDPCVEPKACKTQTEQAAIRRSHVQDGVAMARFLKWVDDEAPKGRLTEMDVVDKLLAFRKLGKDFKDTSFDTIAGWAENGAVVHYNVNNAPEDAKTVTGDGLLLVDSGGQYLDEGSGTAGTTDITRTIAVGKPGREMCENFTRVLNGHIAIAGLRFPDRVTGQEIDALARLALWEESLDFGHGTGHGVGCYLSVHESGAGISPRARDAFKPGKLVSNEPGYYKSGDYGIRIENLVMVEEAGKNESTGAVMLQFNTVSLAPIDRRLVVPEMLYPGHLEWLNDYHKRVYDTIGPHLDKDDRAWLKQACAPIAAPAAGSGPSL